MLTKIEYGNMIRIIDSAAEKGMFAGAELSTVGGLRDKLVAAFSAEEEKEQQELVINTETSEK